MFWVIRVMNMAWMPEGSLTVEGSGVEGLKWPRRLVSPFQRYDSESPNYLRILTPETCITSQTRPKEIHTLFERTVPHSLIDCISDLLRYDPQMRLTSHQCLDHPYLLETSV